MTVLSDLGVLWRWSAEQGRGFSVERTGASFRVLLWEGWVVKRAVEAPARARSLAAAARWARQQMGNAS